MPAPTHADDDVIKDPNWKSTTKRYKEKKRNEMKKNKPFIESFWGRGGEGSMRIAGVNTWIDVSKGRGGGGSMRTLARVLQA